MPKLLIPRRKNIRSHIDHLRDFFVQITNFGSQSKNFKLLKLDDVNFEKSEGSSNFEWQDLLDPDTADDDLVITEFDSFKDFLAIYCKRNG